MMRGGALGMASSVPCGEASHGSPCTSAKIVNVGNAFRPRREIEAVEAVAICREAIRLAFPGPSVEAIAQAASGPLQASPATIRRILDGTTTRFDGGVGFRALAFAAPRLREGKLLALFNRFAGAVHAAQEGRE